MKKIMDDNIEEPKTEEPKPVKPKRQISDAQREHLNKIRELAMKKKSELKEITLKSKLAKTVPKQDLAKQYDEYVENKVKEREQTKKEEVKEVVSDSEVIVKKSKPKKKIVYVSESESESDEEVIIKKSKPKTKAKPQPLEHLVYNNTKDQLYNRMIEERVRNSIIGYGNALGV
jgi:hypothetical protein